MPPTIAPKAINQCCIQLESQQHKNADRSQQNRDPIHDRGSAQLPGDECHQCQRGNVQSIQQRAGKTCLPQSADERAGDGDHYECGQEDAERCEDCAARSAQQISDERSGGENRPRCDLADGHRIQQL